MHHRPPAPPRDVDLGFFDGADVSPERDREVEAALRERAPGLPWEAKNQAAVHLWYPARFGMAVEPFGSSADAIATFPETARAAWASGLRLAAGSHPSAERAAERLLHRLGSSPRRLSFRMQVLGSWT